MIRHIKVLFISLIWVLFLCGCAMESNTAQRSIGADYALVKASDFEAKGLSHSQAILAAMESGRSKSERVRIVLDKHVWIIDRAIELPSNTDLIIDNCTLKLADFKHDNIIRNAGICPNPQNPNGRCIDLKPNSNIKILGVGNAVIEGPEKPFIGYNPNLKKEVEWTGDFYGWRTVGILFAGVENYEIANITMRKTLCWAISQEWGCKRGYLHDITFDTNVKNGDGIDFRNGCSDCVVENIYGTTSDDTVACTALDASLNSPKYIFPMQAFGYDYSKNNDIHSIIIRNIFTTGNHHSVICLATSPKVFNITIENVIEPNDKPSNRESCVKIYTGYGTGYKVGNLHDIKIDNVKSNGAKYALQIKAETKNLTYSNIVAGGKGISIISSN